LNEHKETQNLQELTALRS